MIKKIGTPVYVLRESTGIFNYAPNHGVIIGHHISGTDSKPYLMYKVAFGKNSIEVTATCVYDSKDKLLEAITKGLPSLERIKETHGLKLIYDKV